jgi:hypothetical protein
VVLVKLVTELVSEDFVFLEQRLPVSLPGSQISIEIVA